MRPISPLPALAVLVALVLAAPLAAQDDPAKEIRLLAVDGKFREAESMLLRAPPEVQNDAALRVFVADAAYKAARGAEGAERRDLLRVARNNFGKAVEIKPSDPAAAVGAVSSARDMAEINVALRDVDEARADVKWAIEYGEKAAAGGVASTEFRILLGRMYGQRASYVRTMKDVEQLVSDTTRAATLLAEASAGHEKAGLLLSEASALRARCAHMIHEQIPVETEKRDDEALAAAIDLATQACALPGATDQDYSTHLAALRLAHGWGMKLAQRPFMQPLVPPVQGFKLEIPRAGGWVRTKTADWDLNLERNLNDPRNPGTVQIMLKKWDPKSTTLGREWALLPEVAQRRFEKYCEDFGPESVSQVAPQQLGGRNTLETWHYQVAGQLKSGRTQRIAEWVLWGDRKKESVLQLKVLDWRPSPDVTEPDLVAFVGSVIGEGVWPPGAAPAPGKDDKAGKDPKEPKGPTKPPKKK